MKALTQLDIDTACALVLPGNAFNRVGGPVDGRLVPDFDTQLDFVVDGPQTAHRAAYELVTTWLKWSEEDGDYDNGEQTALEAELLAALDIVNGTRVTEQAMAGAR